MDLVLEWGLAGADLVIEDNDLALGDGLEGAVLLSTYLDARAEDGDTLPDGETDRRGWWGDAFPTVEGDRIGSRLWLLARSTQTQALAKRAESYEREALACLTEDRVSDSVEVTPSFPRAGMLGLEVEITKPKADAAQFRFDYSWGNS